MGGFTLMEVLVTIVILSIGLLGVAGLQLNSLRGNQNAMETSVAVALAIEMVERVRANPPARDANGNFVNNPPRYQFLDSAGTNPACAGSFCTPDQIVLTDAFEWFTRLEDALPGGVGVICQDGTPNDGNGGSAATPWNPMCSGAGGIFVVKVAWDHDRDPSTDFSVYRLSFVP